MENRLKIIVIVREQGEGILQSSFSVGKGTICFRASLRYYCYSSVIALASAHGFSLISSK